LGGKKKEKTGLYSKKAKKSGESLAELSKEKNIKSFLKEKRSRPKRQGAIKRAQVKRTEACEAPVFEGRKEEQWPQRGQKPQRPLRRRTDAA